MNQISYDFDLNVKCEKSNFAIDLKNSHLTSNIFLYDTMVYPSKLDAEQYTSLP